MPRRDAGRYGRHDVRTLRVHAQRAWGRVTCEGPACERGPCSSRSAGAQHGRHRQRVDPERLGVGAAARGGHRLLHQLRLLPGREDASGRPPAAAPRSEARTSGSGTCSERPAAAARRAGPRARCRRRRASPARRARSARRRAPSRQRRHARSRPRPRPRSAGSGACPTPDIGIAGRRRSAQQRQPRVAGRVDDRGREDRRLEADSSTACSASALARKKRVREWWLAPIAEKNTKRSRAGPLGRAHEAQRGDARSAPRSRRAAGRGSRRPGARPCPPRAARGGTRAGWRGRRARSARARAGRRAGADRAPGSARARPPRSAAAAARSRRCRWRR